MEAANPNKSRSVDCASLPPAARNFQEPLEHLQAENSSGSFGCVPQSTQAPLENRDLCFPLENRDGAALSGAVMVTDGICFARRNRQGKVWEKCGKEYLELPVGIALSFVPLLSPSRDYPTGNCGFRRVG